MKKIKLKYLIAILLVSVCVFSAIHFFTNSIDSLKEIDTSINKNWHVKINSKIYENVDLEDFGFDVVNKGDVIILTNTLPEKHFDSPALMLNFFNVAFNVYVDGNTIYSYGHENYEQKKLVGSGIFFIDLPADYRGKEIKIAVKVNENKAFSTIIPFKMGNITDLSFEIVRDDPLGFIITSMLLVFGLVCAFSSAILLLFSKELKEFFLDLSLMGALSFLCGAWSSCNLNFIYIFSNHSVSNVYVEYYSLYLALLPLMFIIFDDKKYKFNKIFFKSLLIIYFVMINLVFFLQLFNIRHLPYMLMPFHIFTIITVISGFLVLIKNMDNRKSDKILRLGYIFALSSVFLHMVLFNFFKFVLKESYKSISITAMFGIVILISSIFLSNIFYWREHYISEQDKKFLQKLAYEDTLTGLSNRQKIIEELKSLQKKHQSYCLVCMDINNLKITNDTHGHQVGDELIKAFSSCLKKISSKNKVIPSRIGGDEFVLIFKNPQKHYVEKYLTKLISLTDTYNKMYEKNKFNISFAYGLAYSHEIKENDYQALFDLADKRMYQMKQNMKENEIAKMQNKKL